MESFTKRLKCLIEEYHLSIRAFEKEVAITEGTLQKAIRNKSVIGIDKIKLITDRYPEVNAGWLVSGQGNMFLDMKSTDKVAEPLARYMSNSQLLARIISNAVRDPHFEEDLLNDLDKVVKDRE